MDRQLAIKLVPFAFVALWSTGFIGAKYALPYIEPFNLLFIRMVINIGVFALMIYWFSAKRLTLAQAGHQMVVGLLVHAAYLGGVFAAIAQGMPAGISSLIVGLQPILTAIIAWGVLSERLGWQQCMGLLLGIVGVGTVLYGNGKLENVAFSAQALGWISLSLVAISIGTLYQKRFGQGVDLITGSLFQYLATAVVLGLVSASFETGEVDWQLPLILSLAWLVLVLSVAAILLLLYMIREGEAAKVASYFYLVPPATALQAWLLFDETFTALALAGVAITVMGVYLAVRKPKPTLKPEALSAR